SIEAVVSYFRKELISFYDKEEIEQFIYISFNEIIGFSRADLILKKADKINESDLVKFSWVVKQLKNNCPIQYIFGRTEFYGIPLKVNNNVLIPRPETEELVQWIINDNKNSKNNILDIGTGSGCIAIALKKNILNATIFAIDISGEALKIAKENAKLNHVEINFSEIDILNFNDENKFPKFDVIVSNPPYVCVSEKQLMKENVLNYEPHLALFVADKEPLLFYKKIIAFAKKVLNPNGKLFFEINESQGELLLDYLDKNGAKNYLLKKDLNGKNRMLQCQF
ncbi:MAG TPA: peptide chain release factor N(5)-glutamine methyltransferase, partial [Bacteroidia bacterium]|nr:peptide chain release factor N(5)-glutamine methyltransferase [Bacteroidia bacterium]